MANKWIKKVSNEALIADARGYRRGVNYFGGNKARLELEGEIKRRQKAGLMSKRVGLPKKQTKQRNQEQNIFPMQW